MCTYKYDLWHDSYFISQSRFSMETSYVQLYFYLSLKMCRGDLYMLIKQTLLLVNFLLVNQFNNNIATTYYLF